MADRKGKGKGKGKGGESSYSRGRLGTIRKDRDTTLGGVKKPSFLPKRPPRRSKKAHFRSRYQC